jgi:ElaB/YqjD/DUF883 family membrane-anchored ribosome-binding protein
MATDYEKALDALRSDVKDLREDLRSVVGALKDRAKDRVSEAREHGEERLHEAADSLRKCGQKVRDRVSTSFEESPVLTLLAAVGAGAILSSLLSRRH